MDNKTLSFLEELQLEHKQWCDKNFPGHESYRQLLGMIEELGELAEAEEDNDQHLRFLIISLGRIAHHDLKLRQGIRVNENHDKKIKDSIADLMIFLAGYCNKKNYNLEAVVKETWDMVKQRDWTKNKVDGIE